MRIVICIQFLLLSIGTAFAQKSASLQEALRFDSKVQQLGTLTEEDAPRSVTFIATNVSGKTLRLERVTTSCSCATAKLSTQQLNPDQQLVVTMTFHPYNHPGTIDADAFLYLAGEDKHPIARLRLAGNVIPGEDEWYRYPYAMGKLRLKQKEIHFNEVKSQGKQTERLLCGNSGSKPLKVSAPILPAYLSFRTEPEVIPPGEEADLVITLDASKLPDSVAHSLNYSLVLDGVGGGRPSDRMLIIRINCIQ